MTCVSLSTYISSSFRASMLLRGPVCVGISRERREGNAGGAGKDKDAPKSIILRPDKPQTSKYVSVSLFVYPTQVIRRPWMLERREKISSMSVESQDIFGVSIFIDTDTDLLHAKVSGCPRLGETFHAVSKHSLVVGSWNFVLLECNPTKASLTVLPTQSPKTPNNPNTSLILKPNPNPINFKLNAKLEPKPTPVIFKNTAIVTDGWYLPGTALVLGSTMPEDKHDNCGQFSGFLSHLMLVFTQTHEKKERSHATPSYPPPSRPLPPTCATPIFRISQLETFDSKSETDILGISTIRLNASDLPNSPRVLHCHDMRGNYLVHDSRYQGGPLGSGEGGYNFKHWDLVDIFCYFSHSLVTIPPKGWIDAGHRHGVRVIGTLITEWEAGEEANKCLCARPDFFAKKLVEVAAYYGFDGWLVNIEAKTPSYSKMLDFVSKLTIRMHSKIPHSQVLFYDSLSPDGSVSYSNKLQKNTNYPFFQVCDGVLINYFWAKGWPRQSASLAGDRRFDVYTGIDVFGRGTYGEGGFNTWVALEEILKGPTSTCLFAPGWTMENASSGLGRFEWERLESKFWEGNNFSRNLLKQPIPTPQIDLKKANNSPWDTCSGGKWAIESCESSYAWVASHTWCTRAQTVDLSDAKILSDAEHMYVEALVKGKGPDVRDYYRLRVRLVDGEDRELFRADSGEIRVGGGWEVVRHVVHLRQMGSAKEGSPQDQGRGRLLLVWEDKAKDTENWGGNYGTMIGPCCVTLSLNSRANSVADFRGRLASISKGSPTRGYASLERLMPVLTTFDQGAGRDVRFRHGKPVRSQDGRGYFNLSGQGLQPILNSNIQDIEESLEALLQSTSTRLRRNAFTVTKDDSEGFDGGVALKIAPMYCQRGTEEMGLCSILSFHCDGENQSGDGEMRISVIAKVVDEAGEASIDSKGSHDQMTNVSLLVVQSTSQTSPDRKFDMLILPLKNKLKPDLTQTLRRKADSLPPCLRRIDAKSTQLDKQWIRWDFVLPPSCKASKISNICVAQFGSDRKKIDPSRLRIYSKHILIGALGIWDAKVDKDPFNLSSIRKLRMTTLWEPSNFTTGGNLISILLRWEAPPESKFFSFFEVYVNGQYVGRAYGMSYLVENLNPKSEAIRVHVLSGNCFGAQMIKDSATCFVRLNRN